MKVQLIKTESSLWFNFKRTMYALMVIAVAIAIPLLSYLELSYNANTNSQKENNIKVEKTASTTEKENTVKL